MNLVKPRTALVFIYYGKPKLVSTIVLYLFMNNQQIIVAKKRGSIRKDTTPILEKQLRINEHLLSPITVLNHPTKSSIKKTKKEKERRLKM